MAENTPEQNQDVPEGFTPTGDDSDVPQGFKPISQPQMSDAGEPNTDEESDLPPGFHPVQSSDMEHPSPVSDSQPAEPEETTIKKIQEGLYRGVQVATGTKFDPKNPPQGILGDLNLAMQMLGNAAVGLHKSYESWKQPAEEAQAGYDATVAKGLGLKPSATPNLPEKAFGAAVGTTMAVPDFLAKGIEGISTNLEVGSGKVKDGMKKGDYPLMAEGTAQVVMTLAQLLSAEKVADEGSGGIEAAGSAARENALKTAGGLLRATSKKVYRYGKDPRAAIIDESITPTNSLTDIQQQLQDAQDKLDNQISTIVRKPKVAANTIDAGQIVLQKAISALQNISQQQGLSNRAAIVKGIQDASREMIQKYDQGGKPSGSIPAQMPPADVLALRRSIQRNTKYLPDPELNDYVNNFKKDVVAGLGDAIDDSAVKGGETSTRSLSGRWANAIEAENLIKDRIAREGKTDTGVANLLRRGEWGAALGLIFEGHPFLGGAMLVNRALRSPAGRLGTIQATSRAGEAMQSGAARSADAALTASGAMSGATNQFPPVPPGMARIRDSHGVIHDLPIENVEKARQRDRGITILDASPIVTGEIPNAPAGPNPTNPATTEQSR